jgi:hypothetical protein
MDRVYESNNVYSRWCEAETRNKEQRAAGKSVFAVCPLERRVATAGVKAASLLRNTESGQRGRLWAGVSTQYRTS